MKKLLPAKDISLFTEEEFRVTWTRMKARKSPGLEGIPPEAVKLAAEVRTETVLQVMNYTLLHEEFPAGWNS